MFGEKERKIYDMEIDAYINQITNKNKIIAKIDESLAFNNDILSSNNNFFSIISTSDLKCDF